MVIIADGLSLRHAREYGGTSLLSLLSSACIGVANSRTADGGDRLLSGAVTLGAGRRMAARESAGLGLGRDETFNTEKASDIYLRRTGRAAELQPMLPVGCILCLGFPELEAMGRQSPYRGKPGLIGESLRRADLFAAAIGNSDDNAALVRPGVLLVADAKGYVAGGSVGSEVTKVDPSAPFGVSCDVEAMARTAGDAVFRLQASVVAVDFGDLNRLLRYCVNLAPKAAADQLGKCYSQLDHLLCALFDTVGPPSDDLAYILLSPGQPSSLAPVAVAGWRYPPGYLSSETTRREGLVANLDVAATILSGLGVPEAWSHDGSPMVGLPGRRGEDIIERIMSLEESLQTAASSRVPVLSAFIGMVVVAVFSVLGVAVFAARMPRFIVVAVKCLLLSVAVQPVLIIAAPIFGIQGVAATILFVIPGSAVLACVLVRTLPSCTWASVGISAITAIAILADTFSGGTLAATSLLGHSAVVGARYYGIGNELMGVLTGSVVIVLAAVGEAQFRSRGEASDALTVATGCTAIGVGITSLVLGHPGVGANFGGMLTAAAVGVFLGATAISRSALSRRAKAVSMSFVVICAVVACVGMAWADAHGERSSHIGKAWRLLTHDGNLTQPGEVDGRSIPVENGGSVDGSSLTPTRGLGRLAVIASRKLSMNIRLLRYTAWTRVLIAFLVSITVLAGKPFGTFRRFRDDHPTLHSAFLGALVGALTAMVVNDSGVVACATVAMMPTFTLLGYVVDEILVERV